MSHADLDTHACLPAQLEKKNGLTLALWHQRAKMRLSARWRKEKAKEQEGETGGHILSSALMTFGKQRAPSALEETEYICYRAQAYNLILDHCNEIHTIYATLNNLIYYRNPSQDYFISNLFFILWKSYKNPFFQRAHSMIKLKCSQCCDTSLK